MQSDSGRSNDIHYEEEIANGNVCLAYGELDGARFHFTRAHALGHSSKASHLKAHSALLRAAWRQRSPTQLMRQLGLLLLALCSDEGIRERWSFRQLSNVRHSSLSSREESPK
jgi:hypothetical protein